MFGTTNPFGQPASSPFGQTNPSSNPFAPKSSFGSPTPFSSQTGGSLFGGTSTGVFGAAQPSSPFSSTTTFGASSSPAFGSSVPAFGSSSTPAFGNSSSSFGGPSGFGQKPAFGFGSTPTQSSPFGSSGQQSQPTFGSGIFGSSTPFGSTQSAFGATSTPAFGATSTPAFGATSTPAFGATSTPAFGATSTPAFGATSTPAFGATSTPAFGATSTPAFGSTSSPAFGSTGSPFGSTGTAFGVSNAPAFGASSTPAFGTSSTPAFGASSTPSFSFGSSPAFGQSTAAFGSSPFGTTTVGAQSSPFGSQSSSPAFGSTTFGQSAFGGQRGGSRVAPYTPTTDADSGSGTQPAAKLESISAMHVYKDKSHEELRWEDYQLGDKGGPQPAAQPSGGIGFGVSAAPASPFGSSSTIGQTPANPFSGTSANPFSIKPPSFNSASFTTSTTTSNPFQSTSSSLFGSSSSTTPSIFSSSAPAFGTGSSLFSSSVSPSFSSSPSIFGTGAAPATTPTFATGLNFGSSQGSSLFNSTPAIGQASSTFGQNTSSFGPTSIFNTPSTGFSGNMFSSSLSLPPSSNPTAFGSTTVTDKPVPVRISPLLTSRYISQRRIRLPARKYHPNNDNPKVPFFNDDEETPSTPKADAVFIPRENPRALVIRPTENWPSRASVEKVSPLKDASTLVHENGKISDDGSNAEDKDKNPAENGLVKEQIHHNQKANGVHDDHSVQKEDSFRTLSGHRAGEAAIVYEHGADVEALMPKLRRSDYYTEPRIQELAAKERAEPGYCRRVKDFVVGRHGYGSIKFLGETHVRCLDLESLVQFNNREVIVYMDDSKKPPVGQGLNKPAEVTLLNIKCFDKRTREQYTEGPKVEKYKEMLKKKAEDQGADFLSYDPIKGEWRFRVNHFSKYQLEDEEEDVL
ncbi:nuclear pore complex protein NUP98A isoform X3 [Gossypium hirsutum]|uniref:Nuclear pore complex protein NUP98A isoform X3 n=1 Tax=Gossypium hirsutum TaxID=3635 RepID=A0ABM3AJQ9_GOSHI|nr:nuclear pore complex protein NUP98A isoform X3 [Gossypium hirsutum]